MQARLSAAAQRLDREGIEEAMRTGDAMRATLLAREALLGETQRGETQRGETQRGKKDA